MLGAGLEDRFPQKPERNPPRGVRRVPKAHSKLQGTGCFRDGGLGLALPWRKVPPSSMSVERAAGRTGRGLCSRKGLTALRTPALNT